MSLESGFHDDHHQHQDTRADADRDHYGNPLKWIVNEGENHEKKMMSFVHEVIKVGKIRHLMAKQDAEEDVKHQDDDENGGKIF